MTATSRRRYTGSSTQLRLEAIQRRRRSAIWWAPWRKRSSSRQMKAWRLALPPRDDELRRHGGLWSPQAGNASCAGRAGVPLGKRVRSRLRNPTRSSGSSAKPWAPARPPS